MTEFKESPRGFRHYEPIKSTYGHRIRVYESSAADAPHLWVNIEGRINYRPETVVVHRNSLMGDTHEAQGDAAAHMTLEQAKALRDALDTAIENHYQLRGA
jgi:hypothetical protein